MTTNIYANYLHDLGEALKASALETRQAASEFDQGRRMAYYEVLTTMKNMAETFGVPAADLRLADVDRERDLLGLTKRQPK